MIAVRPDESSPLGITCKLGRHAPEIVYSPERLRQPLRRVGPKGTMEFEPITWDEALNEIVERLQETKAQYGPEAACIYTGRGSFELAMCDVFQPKDVAVSSASSLLFPFGSPNTMGVGALCYVSMAMIAPHVTMGGMFVNMFSDIDNAELIVVWGANPATDSPPLDYGRIRQATARGAKLVVIDPRRTQTAKLPGAQWVPIRPGTDGALALGLCAVIIAEELYDESFAADWCLGFDEFADHVQHYRPEVVESITGVSAIAVVELARAIAAAHGAAPVMYTGLEYSDCGVQAIRATMVLWALAGQLDVPGGRCFGMSENLFPMNRAGHVANPDPAKAVGRDAFGVYSAYRGEGHANALPDAVLKGEPYPIRSLFVLGASLTTSWPQPEVWRRTLAGLDHLVCMDLFLTGDCAYADLVLPATTWFEIESYMTYGPIFRIRERVIEPQGQAKNAFFVFSELAQRLGYGHLYPQTEEELLVHALGASDFSLEQVRAAGGQVSLDPVMMQYRKWEKGLLRADGEPGFDTPSGKLEIASSVLEEYGYEPLPRYTEPAESPTSRPDLAEDYPLVFTSGSRVNTDFRSQFHHIPGLVKQRPEPTVMINQADAEARGIAHGDLVEVASPRGKVRLRAIVTSDIVAGCVEANMGGGGPLGPKAWREANINDLTDLRYDPISGFPIYKALLCQVVKAGEQNGRVEIGSGEDPMEPVGLQPALPEPAARIYLDHNATTPLDSEVLLAMEQFAAQCSGNPSSIYHDGRQAQQAVAAARRKMGGLLGCTARRVVFTGGGSEANNLAIKGLAWANPDRRHLITTAIEHPSVLAACKWLASQGLDLTVLGVDSDGRVRPGDLAEALRDDTLLVSVMLANNETGAIQPVAELAELAHARGAWFHSDAVQAIGKMAISVDELGVDLLTLSAHKFHGPKGIGALFVRKGVELTPLVHGGGQEWGLRSGTENTVGIVGLGRATEMAVQRLGKMEREVAAMRDALQAGLATLVPEMRVNGHPTHRLPHALNVTLPGLRGESLVMALDPRGVSLSAGSACHSGSPKPSAALLAMGLSEEEAHCALRFSLGIDNTQEHIKATLKAMAEILDHKGATVRFAPCR